MMRAIFPAKNVQLTKDADGTEYIHFSERQTKIRSGVNPRNVRPIRPRAFATTDLSLELDLKQRAESMKKPEMRPFVWVYEKLR